MADPVVLVRVLGSVHHNTTHNQPLSAWRTWKHCLGCVLTSELHHSVHKSCKPTRCPQRSHLRIWGWGWGGRA
jgi:hypothetical protein